jgi:hypothetical protein
MMHGPTGRSTRRNDVRSYPTDSPEAAARIVALVLIADGQMCSSELEQLTKLGAERALGLEPHLLPHLVYTLREELHARRGETGSPVNGIDDAMLASLLAEIRDPALQGTVLRLSQAAAQADGRVVDGEAWVVQAARKQWNLTETTPSAGQKPLRRGAG